MNEGAPAADAEAGVRAAPAADPQADVPAPTAADAESGARKAPPADAGPGTRMSPPVDAEAGVRTAPPADAESGVRTALPADAESGVRKALPADAGSGTPMSPPVDAEAGMRMAPPADAEAGVAAGPPVDAEAGVPMRPAADAESRARAAPPADAVRDAVLGETTGWRRWRRPLLWLALAALAAAALAWWLAASRTAGAVSYRTVPVTRGDVVLTVTANGTLQPTRAVNIGSELSGTVARVLVDVNDVVKKGQVLVELDTSKLRDQVERSRAALAAAVAALAQASATRVEATANQARLESMNRESNGGFPAPQDLDAGRATLARAVAAERSASANVDNARAALSTDTTNLAKASIRSPIDGVILTRNVDPGNAVAASLQAVTLFQLAEDLRHLRLLVNVDEADVGQVREGMAARFTVSSYPARQYPAKIFRVSYGSTLTDNVVTYISYLDVDNADLSLRPGMTATATIRAAQRHDVLLVPNSALRFTPSAAGEGERRGLVGRLMPRMPRTTRQSGVAGAAARHRVWVLEDGRPAAVDIATGISDGRVTEVVSGKLRPGMQVITEQLSNTPPP